MNLNHPPKTSIDEYTDSKSRETPRFVFFILKFSVALYLDLYKTQKAHKKTREESLQNFGEILIVILNFLDVAQKRL